MKKILLLLVAIFLSTNCILNAQSIKEIEIAEALFNENKWEQAISAYKKILNKNEYNGAYNYNLAQSYFYLGKYNDAIICFKKSLKLGYKYGLCIKKIAQSYVFLKDNKNLPVWIEKGIQTPKSLTVLDILSDSIFKDFRGTNNFKSIFPENSSFSRTEKWMSDIKFLKKRFESKHYNIFNTIGKEEWELKFSKLLEGIESKSNTNILVELMKITTSIGDGHTFIRPPISGNYKLHFYPFKLYMFEEGLFVTQTSKTYKNALGLKLTHINSISINKVLEKMAEVISRDNDIGLMERYDFNLMFSEVLYELNITSNPKQANFTFLDKNNKELTINVLAKEFKPQDLTEKVESKIANKPLYLKNEGKFFWSKELTDLNAMYIKLNINLSTPESNIKEFYRKVFDTISEKKIKNLVIDLRHCPGGNSFNNKTLIKLILASKTLDKESGIFTIIGRRTFSAAMNLASDLEEWTNTTFIGEPTGSKPNFIGETNFVVLPNTAIQVSISDAYWQQTVSWDKRKWIAPKIYLPNRFKDYIKGTPIAINTIASIIASK